MCGEVNISLHIADHGDFLDHSLGSSPSQK